MLLTCIILRLPNGSVNNPDTKDPKGTHNRFIEPEKVINYCLQMIPATS